MGLRLKMVLEDENEKIFEVNIDTDGLDIDECAAACQALRVRRVSETPLMKMIEGAALIGTVNKHVFL